MKAAKSRASGRRGGKGRVKKDLLDMKLKVPIAAEAGERVVISRMVMERWRLIGYGNIK